jgi:hypothetical protein
MPAPVHPPLIRLPALRPVLAAPEPAGGGEPALLRQGVAGLRGCRIVVDGAAPWGDHRPCPEDRPAQVLRSQGLADRPEPASKGVPVGRDRPRAIRPLRGALQSGLLDAGRRRGGASSPPAAGGQRRRILRALAKSRGRGDGHTAVPQAFLHIPIAQGLAQGPAAPAEEPCPCNVAPVER